MHVQKLVRFETRSLVIFISCSVVVRTFSIAHIKRRFLPRDPNKRFFYPGLENRDAFQRFFYPGLENRGVFQRFFLVQNCSSEVLPSGVEAASQNQ